MYVCVRGLQEQVIFLKSYFNVKINIENVSNVHLYNKVNV